MYVFLTLTTFLLCVNLTRAQTINIKKRSVLTYLWFCGKVHLFWLLVDGLLNIESSRLSQPPPDVKVPGRWDGSSAATVQLQPPRPEYHRNNHNCSRTAARASTISTGPAVAAALQLCSQSAAVYCQRFMCNKCMYVRVTSALLSLVSVACCLKLAVHWSIRKVFLWITAPQQRDLSRTLQLSFFILFVFFASWLTDLFVYIGIFRFNWPCLMCCHSVFTLRRALVRPERTPNTNNRSRARRSEPTERGNRWNDVFLRPLN